MWLFQLSCSKHINLKAPSTFSSIQVLAPSLAACWRSDQWSIHKQTVRPHVSACVKENHWNHIQRQAEEFAMRLLFGRFSAFSYPTGTLLKDLNPRRHITLCILPDNYAATSLSTAQIFEACVGDLPARRNCWWPRRPPACHSHLQWKHSPRRCVPWRFPQSPPAIQQKPPGPPAACWPSDGGAALSQTQWHWKTAAAARWP